MKESYFESIRHPDLSKKLYDASPVDHSKDSYIERILHPDHNSKSIYSGKLFKSSKNYNSKFFKTSEYAGLKEFESKSFATKTFEGARHSWMGKMLFPEKKLPAQFQGENRDAKKAFASKEFASKNYADMGKKSDYSVQKVFPSKVISLKGKTQGAFDNNPKLGEAIKKGLSVDDVRNLLNKGPSF